MTDDKTAAQEEDQAARRRMKEAAAKARRAKKEARELKKLRAKIVKWHDEELAGLDSAIADSRAEARTAYGEAIQLAINRPFVPYEILPSAEIEDVVGWSREYRRRAWATAFTRDTFKDKSGTSALFLLLSLAALMERQASQKIEIDLPGIVRVSAMDYKTVRTGLQNLRDAGHLLWLGPNTYALSDAHLVPLAESPEIPLNHLAGRFFLGNYEHDAFGGQHGIKTTEIRVWAWLLFNPNSTRYQIAKGARVGKQTAYRVIDQLVQMRLAKSGDGDLYTALGAERHARRWLDDITDLRGLWGAVEERVRRAIEPGFVKKARLPVPEKQEQHSERTSSLSPERLAALDFSDVEPLTDEWFGIFEEDAAIAVNPVQMDKAVVVCA